MCDLWIFRLVYVEFNPKDRIRQNNCHILKPLHLATAALQHFKTDEMFEMVSML